MTRKTITLAFTLMLLTSVSIVVRAGKPWGAAYIDGKQSKIAVILCHGRGKNPRWLVVNPLRKAIAQQLGYHTLSLQMPTKRDNWHEYLNDFPDAYISIKQGIDFLKKEKGVHTVYLLGHSMGSRMASGYLAKTRNHGIKGFIGVGIRNGGEAELNSDANLRQVTIPVLDVYGDGGDGKDKRHAAMRADMVSSRYQQVLIKGANHKFTGTGKEKMVDAVVKWLKTQR